MNSRRIFLNGAAISLLFSIGLSRAQGTMIDFTKPEPMMACWTVNDGVMGGISQSKLSQDKLGMLFEGQVSLENKGGFASMRSKVKFLQDTQAIELSAMGDGKLYKLILRTTLAQRITYESDFLAEKSWQIHRFKSNQFKSTFRGRAINAPALSFSDVIEFGILIANNQEGIFKLQLQSLQSF